MACDLSRATLLRAALPYANTMVDLGETKSMSLSLRLLREGLTVEQALRDDHELEKQPAEPGRLFVGQVPALPPTWFGFIDEFATGSLPRLVNQSCAAILFLEVVDGRKRRTFALSFGTGHHSLEPDSFERNFGLRVVLNAVARSNLRSVDVATLDATTFQKRRLAVMRTCRVSVLMLTAT
jgi:uncharacterized protein (TIGR04141 family)